MSVVLDVGIGLVLMYLLLSLLVTAVNELIAQFGSIRAKHLNSALRRMLDLKATPGDADNLALFDAIMSGPTLQIAGAVSKTKWSGGKALPSVDRFGGTANGSAGASRAGSSTTALASPEHGGFVPREGDQLAGASNSKRAALARQRRSAV